MILPFKFIFITAMVVNYNLKMASTGKSKEEHKRDKQNLKTIYRYMRNTDTQVQEILCCTERHFQPQSHIQFNDVPAMTSEEKEININKAYTDIQCSYIFSAQIYMRLIEGLLINKEQLEKVPQDIDISFTKEAAQMMATLYNVEEMRVTFTKKVLWIVLVFAERVLIYMKSVIKGDQAEDQTTIVSAHNSVSSLLEYYMESDDCVDYSKKNKLDDELSLKDVTLQNLINQIELKKLIFMHRIDTNDKHSISTAGYERFSLNVLSLNGLFADIEATKRILESFDVEVKWDELLPHLKKEYDQGVQAIGITLSQQINSLKTFNDKFILMVKVIITRLILKFVMYINNNKCNARKNWKIVQKTKTKILLDIYELENYLQIQDHVDVIYVRRLLKKMYFPFDSKKIIEKIKNQLNEIALDLYNAKVWCSFKIPEYPQESIITTCGHIQKRVEHVVTYLKDNVLVNINFSIIKTFKRLIGTDEFLTLEDFEKYKNYYE